MTIYLVEELHFGWSEHQFARYEVLTQNRLLRVPKQCADCLGVPEVVIPLPGYQASLMILHTATCPALGAMLRRRDGAP